MAETDSTISSTGDTSVWFKKLLFDSANRSGQVISPERTLLLARDLQSYTRGQIEPAFDRCHKEGSGFVPHAAEVIRQIEGSPDDKALIAWGSLERAASSVGAYRSVEFEDTATAAALVRTFGGWAQYCHTELGPAMMVKRQEFLANYRAARREPEPNGPIRVSGVLEATTAYERRPSSTVGRITASGDVAVMPETPQLPAAPIVNRLTEGEVVDGEA